MQKTLTLTGLILAFVLGNLGTSSAQAHSLSKSEASVLHHNYLVSVHTVRWYNNKGRWTLHVKYDKCSMVPSNKRERICRKARHLLEAHAVRRDRIYSLLHPEPVYDTGGYNWDRMVHLCEAKGHTGISAWYTNTGNGFFFGPQFTPGTWHSSGGGPVREMGDRNGLPMSSYSIPYIEHIANNTMQLQGPGAWPNCHGYL